MIEGEQLTNMKLHEVIECDTVDIFGESYRHKYIFTEEKKKATIIRIIGGWLVKWFEGSWGQNTIFIPYSSDPLFNLK